MNNSKNYFTIALQHFVEVVLFILVPLIAVLYIGQHIIAYESNINLSETSDGIKNLLRDMEVETDSDYYMLKTANQIWDEYKQNLNKKDNFWAYYDKICDSLKLKPDLYLFDSGGNLVTPERYNLKSRDLASKLWNAVGEPYEEKSNTAKKYKEQFKSFLGSEFRLVQFLESRNNLMPIIINSKPGCLYWMTRSDKLREGIILVFWEIPTFDFRFRQILDKYSSKFDDLFVKNDNGSIDYYGNNNSHESKSEYEKIYNGCFKEKEDKYYVDDKGLTWRYVKFNNSQLFGALKCDYLKYRFFSNLLLFIICAASIILVSFYLLAVIKHQFVFSIRTKIITLFLIAVFTPVICYIALGYQYITDLDSNNHINIWKESREILLDIDRELGSSGNIFIEDFRKMVKDYQRYDEDPEIRKEFAVSLADNDLVEIDRRLVSDASLISQLTNYVFYDKINDVTGPFAKCCIDATSNTTLLNSVAPVIRNTMHDPESALTNFWHRPDRVQDFVFGTTQFYLYWNYAESAEHGKEYFFILRSMDKVLRNHLKKRLLECKTNSKERNYFIIGCNNKINEWFPDNDLENQLKANSKRVFVTGKPIETHITIGSKVYLLLGLRCYKLKGYSLFALYPHEKIDEEINEVVKEMILRIVLFIAAALIIGYMLTNSFLYPVKNLGEGIKAIEARNSEFRIEVLENDEFGNLAVNFNKMISNLKEVDLAKSIQESLLPNALPNVKDYELSFSNKMASGIGGDYFDTFLLDDDNLCVVIGDVSGHGAASAFVMAMAKSVLYNGFKETRNIIELFGDLNSVVNTYFGKPPVKKMITLFAAIINLPTGKTVFLDAGHNYPMKITVDGLVNEIKMTGLPIGVMKKMRKVKTDEFVIDKGETIVFYTDGIVEATGKTPEQYGYDRFKQNLSELCKESAETIKNTLLENYKKWEDGTEPDDDVTLFVLKRLAS